MKRATDFLLAVLWALALLAIVNTLAGYEVPQEPTARVVEETLPKPPRRPPRRETNYTYLGTFSCTGYCSCAQCCGQWAYNRPVDENGEPIVYGASGQRLEPNRSVAVDTSVIPYGSILLIEGREYIAADTGAFRGAHIDFYCGSHEEALAVGNGTKEVYIKEANK